MSRNESSAAGHRLVPHTADLIIEAWAPTKLACLEQAARALVDSFAAVDDVAVTEPIPITLEMEEDEALLVSLLDEIIYVVDVLGSIPVRVTLEETEDGRIAGFFEVAPAASVETHGALPKGVSLSDLMLEYEDGGWRCRATIDV